MEEKIYFSDKLQLNYKIKFDGNGIRRVIFEDNINYSDNEMKKIKNCSVREMNNIHNLKKSFGGFIT